MLGSALCGCVYLHGITMSVGVEEGKDTCKETEMELAPSLGRSVSCQNLIHVVIVKGSVRMKNKTEKKI